MKKILLFLVMCLSSFLIYENCSALEVSEVNDENILQYIEEKYPTYIRNYSFLYKTSNTYNFISADNIFYFKIASDTKVNVQILNPTSKVNYSYISLKTSDLTVDYINNNLSVAASNKFGMNIGYADRIGYYYCNFDLYAIDSDFNILDTLLYAKNFPIEAEPSPSPSPEPSDEPEFPPETSAPTDDTGGVSANRVISVYMKYFLMCLPVGLIMVMFEKFIEIIHNFILGKMRK